MAFWGVEVEQGKPYIHRFDSELGRLRLSQATLGSGSSTKKSIVQCSVGSNPPINLCSLLPEMNETSQLNLEFEEDEDVTFSVVGPTSVHLSGFYYGENQDDTEEDDNGLDYFEEDSSDSLDESGDGSTDVDSMDDFSDEDLAMYPASRKANSGVKIEEIDNEKPANEKDSTEQNNTIHQVSDSEDEDGFPISSTGKNELKDGKKMDEELVNKKRKDGVESNNKLKRKIEALREDGEHARNVSNTDDSLPQTHVNVIGSDTKSKENNKKKNKKKLKLEEVARGNNETLDSTNISSAAREISQKTINEENVGNIDNSLPQAHVNDMVIGSDTKSKKKNKKKLKMEEVARHNNETLDSTNTSSGAREISQKTINEKKDKKKNKDKKQDTASNLNKVENIADKQSKVIEMEPEPIRTFPNGMVVEELAMGKPNGKKAANGKKISMRYIGKLKKNGKIFDSNIGKAPLKFRLGAGEVIQGWDVGVNGMRVGGKRRLTIPPSMGYGSKGAGGVIPGNAWLVFDVELMDVN